MKLALLVPRLSRGGAERQAVLLAGAAASRGHEVVLITMLPADGFAADLAAAGVRELCLGAGGGLAAAALGMRLAGALRSERPDVVYSFLPHANVLAALAKPFARCPVVWSVRSSDMPLDAYGAGTRLAYRAEPWLAWLPEAIVANSAAGREVLVRRGYPPTRVHVVSNGFDTDKFAPDAEARERGRRLLGIAAGEILVALPARLDPVKDHETFLRAAAMLAKSRADVRFACIGGGDGEYAGRMRALGETLGLGGRMIWAGEQSDMPAALNAADVAVLCSVSEGFPNAVGEALACGSPCVVTDVGDCARLIGDTGRVVARGDAAGLARAIGELAGDSELRARLGEAARARIVAEFSLARMVDTTLALLAEVAARRVAAGGPIDARRPGR